MEERLLIKIRKIFNENKVGLGLASLTEEDQDHLITCGAKAVETYLGINKYHHGSFAKAVAENNLRDAFNCADEVNTRGMKFHAMLMSMSYRLAYVDDTVNDTVNTK
jgi:hypothetical protein